MRRFVHPYAMVPLFVFAATIALADDLPSCGGYPVTLSVSPARPGCADPVILGATQWLSDSCWTAETPVFSAESPDYSVQLTSIDLWPQFGCLFVIIEIPFTWQVGPLSPGPYSFEATHHSISARQGDSDCADRIVFDVTCCPDVPPAVSAVRAGVEVAGSGLRLTWDDVAGADDYVVFGSDEPDGVFTRRVATASNGSAGAGIPVDSTPTFLLVGARNACGIGPRHGTPPGS